MKFIKDMITENDNKTYDLAKFCLFVGVVVFLALSLKRYDSFDPESFGIGFGSLLAAGGLGVGARSRLEKGVGKDAE